MALSLLEFGIFGFVCYFSIAMLIWLTVTNKMPTGIESAMMRVVFIMPGIIAAGFLAGSDTEIVLYEIERTEVGIEDYVYSQTGGENSSNIGSIALNQTVTEKAVVNIEAYPAFIWLHYLFMIVMVIWAVYHILNTLREWPRRKKGFAG